MTELRLHKYMPPSGFCFYIYKIGRVHFVVELEITRVPNATGATPWNTAITGRAPFLRKTLSLRIHYRVTGRVTRVERDHKTGSQGSSQQIWLHCSPVCLGPKKWIGEYSFFHDFSHHYQTHDSFNIKIPQEANNVHCVYLVDAVHIIQDLGSDIFLQSLTSSQLSKSFPFIHKFIKCSDFNGKGHIIRLEHYQWVLGHHVLSLSNSERRCNSLQK